MANTCFVGLFHQSALHASCVVLLRTNHFENSFFNCFLHRMNRRQVHLNRWKSRWSLVPTEYFYVYQIKRDKIWEAGQGVSIEREILTLDPACISFPP